MSNGGCAASPSGEIFANIFNQNIRLWTDANAPYELGVRKGEADRFAAGENQNQGDGFDVFADIADRDSRSKRNRPGH